MFNKRTYSNPIDICRDLLFPFKNRSKLREIRQKKLLSPAFQERLILAVTSVYRCRHCSYFHARLALQNGIAKDEINTLLAGVTDKCPDDELLAILYAQHWAESNARPDPEAKERLLNTYGEGKAGAIELILRMIRLGNLFGNTWDYFLYRISFGKLGV